MSEQGQFDLCPKCGAIARDGVCQSCGYEIPGVKEALAQSVEQQEAQVEQPVEQQETQVEQPVEQQATQMEQQSTDDMVYSSSDVYQSQSSQDIYQTPDTNSDSNRNDSFVSTEAEMGSTGGLFSGEQQTENTDNTNNTYYGNTYVGNASYNSNPYNNNPYNNNPYAANNQVNNGSYTNPYGNNSYTGNTNENNTYGQNPYDNNQNNNQFNGNNPYAGNTQNNGNAQYTGNMQNNGNAQYTGNNAYGNGQYGNNNAYGNMNGYNQYGANPYSPYAVPQQKKHTGLIIGIIIGVVLLFFIALFALLYRAFDSYSDEKKTVSDSYNEKEHDDFEYDDYDYDFDLDDYEDDDNYSDDYDYDDYDYDDYDDEGYYSLHDDIKYDLSYSIEWEYYEYETDLENVSIAVDYPVIVGDDVPNLDKLNAEIAEEAEFFTEYFEEEYREYLDEDGYFGVYAGAYVTYMTEDILSIVFSEDVYSDYFDSVSLYCINIDMENGVILDNNDLLDIDDEFSVDFRVRSDKQNGTVSGLDAMSDQEITDYLSSSNLIVFYIPQGMEIGLNYEDGWVTVTYQDYENYLNIF